MPLNILYSSISGNNKGEAQTHRKVLAALGHEVTWITSPSQGGAVDDPGHVPEPGLPVGISLKNVLRYVEKRPDLFLYVEPLGLVPEDLHEAPFPTACVISDFHNHLESRLNLALFFDHVFVWLMGKTSANEQELRRNRR